MAKKYVGYQFKPGDRCNIEQYRRLKRCSDRKDISEWNAWRDENRSEEIWLSGAKLMDAHLEDADLRDAHLEGAKMWNAHLKGAHLRAAHLEGAELLAAHLAGAELLAAHLEGASLVSAYLEGANLAFAHVGRALLWHAHLEGAALGLAHLKGADLRGAYLEGAVLAGADLKGANLWGVHLEGADLTGATMRAARFNMVSVDGGTTLTGCKIDRDTLFTGAALDNARVEPGLKQLLEYNVRRHRWIEWCRAHRVLRWPVRLFWELSDYGRSTQRILQSLWCCAFFFAGLYLFVALGCYWGSSGRNTGMIANVLERDGVPVPAWLVPSRVLYFSVVTMTTLGLGDMYARPDSLAGHVVLAVQVLIGYMLLAALVTRFAVLFQAGGPAGRFDDERRSTWGRIRRTLRVDAMLIRRWLRRRTAAKAANRAKRKKPARKG